MPKTISILTAWGNGYGSGHIQRMASLLNYLVEMNLSVYIVCDNLPDFFPESVKKYYINNVPENSDLIIIDKRDSKLEEIVNLQKIAPVITIDDLGTGRKSANLSIDLLPNLEHDYYETFEKSPFIYGYNFYNSIENIKNITNNINYDFCIYSGFSNDKKYQEFIFDIIPENSRVALLNGKDTLLCENNKFSRTINTPYCEILLSSNTLISHFGITIFEGFLANCNIITINPTAYHSNLSDKSKDILNLTNLGVYPDIDKTKARSILLKKAKLNSPELNIVKGKIAKNLDNFYSLIEKFII